MKRDADLARVADAVEAEPWSSVVLAFATGAFLAWLEPRGKVTRALASTARAIARTAIRQAAIARATAVARSWIDARICRANIAARSA